MAAGYTLALVCKGNNSFRQFAGIYIIPIFTARNQETLWMM